MKILKILLVLVLQLTVVFSNGQNCPYRVKWDRTYGGSDDDFSSNNTTNCIAQTRDKGYIIGTTTSSNKSGNKSQNAKGASDFWIVKLDSNGSILWDKSIGGNAFELFGAVIQTNDNGFIVGGNSNSPISGDKSQNRKGSSDFWIVKLDSIGQVIWDKTIGGVSGDNVLRSIRQTENNGYILAGLSNSNISGDKSQNVIGGMDYWIVKIDSSGNKLWDKTYGGILAEELISIHTTRDKGYVIGGSSSSNISGDKSQNSKGLKDFWVVKLDSNGNKMWDKTIGGNSWDELHVLETTEDGGFILGGDSYSNISGDKSQNSLGSSDYWIVKLDSNGNVMWDRTIGGSLKDQIYGIQQLSGNRYILGGNSQSNISGNKTASNIGFENFWIVMIDSMGNVIWDMTIGGNSSDIYPVVRKTMDDGFIIGGFSSSNISGNKTQKSYGKNDMWVVKLKPALYSISGSIFADINKNDSLNIFEPKVKNILIYNEYENTYSSSNDSTFTHYLFTIDSAKLRLENIYSNFKLDQKYDPIKIKFGIGSKIDTSNVNIPIQYKTAPCAKPKISSISHDIFRGCLWSVIKINYENEEFDTVKNAILIVELDTVHIDTLYSASSFIKEGNKLIFYIGNILPFSYKSLNIQVRIKCRPKIGASICTRAILSLINNCHTYPDFDSSDIQFTSSCKNDTVFMKLENKSLNKDMKQWGSVSGYEGMTLKMLDTFKLNKNTSTIFKHKVDSNKVFTMIVDGKNGNPVTPIIIRHDDHCAVKTPIIFNNPALSFSRYDEADEYEEDCDIIRGSYDPNLKSVQPEGMFAQHYTAPNETLKYRIDFQNTGTDTAFKVEVVDTLSPYLNLLSIEPGMSSHPYKLNIDGDHTLRFTFSPIQLPDSNVNEPGSHGYVTFKIKAKQNIPTKAIITNNVDIYFDYNTPVRTNTVFNTMFDTVQIWVPKKDSTNNTSGLHNKLVNNINLYPNPVTENLIIHFNNIETAMEMIIIDMKGIVVYKETLNKQLSTINVSVGNYNKGIYLLQLRGANGVVYEQKIVKE